MTRMSSRLVRATLAAAAGFVVLFAAEKMSPTQSGLITTAEAVIGRPLTPMSYAGVARRTTRRAAAVGAATAAGAAAACYQTVDAYGRGYTRCLCAQPAAGGSLPRTAAYQPQPAAAGYQSALRPQAPQGGET